MSVSVASWIVTRHTAENMPFYNRFDSPKAELVSEMMEFDSHHSTPFGMVATIPLYAGHGVGIREHVANRFESA